LLCSMKLPTLLLATAFVGGAQGAAHFCPCLQPAGAVLVPCNSSLNLSGTCALADKVAGSPFLAPDYGASCKVHKEPTQADCTNQATGAEMPHTDSNKWCWEPYCFVDACTCDQPDMNIGVSAYFKNAKSMAYSYANCGGVDYWAASDASVETFSKARPADCHQNCSAVKDFYKNMECCGMPSKKIPYPMNYPYRNNIPYAADYHPKK